MNFQSNPRSDGELNAESDGTPPSQSRTEKRKSRATRRCSMCEKLFDPADSRCLPFCSARCQQLDLGNWLTESYGFPLDGQEEIEHDAIE